MCWGSCFPSHTPVTFALEEPQAVICGQGFWQRKMQICGWSTEEVSDSYVINSGDWKGWQGRAKELSREESKAMGEPCQGGLIEPKGPISFFLTGFPHWLASGERKWYEVFSKKWNLVRSLYGENVSATFSEMRAWRGAGRSPLDGVCLSMGVMRERECALYLLSWVCPII